MVARSENDPTAQQNRSESDSTAQQNQRAEQGAMFDMTTGVGMQGDDAATAAGAAAAAAVAPIDATAAGPREMFGLTSGDTSETSDIQKISGMSSIFAPTPKARRRGAGEISGSGTTSRQSSRPPSQAPSGSGGIEADRLVHRRVDSTSDSYLGRLKHLEEQHEADREAIGHLKDAVIELQAKVSAHDANLAKIRRASDLAAKNVVGVEAAVLKRIDDQKGFIGKEFEGKLEKMREHIVSGIECEMTSKDRFTKHLIGHDTPVLQPLIEETMRDKITEVDGKLKILNAWVAARTHRDNKVEAYLQELHTARPEEGKVVGTAFMAVAQELLEIRAVAGAAARQPGNAPGAGGGGGGGGGGGAAPDSAAFDELSKQVAFIQGTLLQGKCHCVHVDQHELRFGAVEQRIMGSERHLKILEGALRQPQRPTAAVQQPPANLCGTYQQVPCAAAAAASTASCPCGPCDPDPWASYNTAGPRAPAGGGGGSGTPWFVAEKHGGNGVCHCVHLVELASVVDELKGQVEEIAHDRDGFDPWADPTVGAHYGTGRARRAKPQPLPLELGPLGQLTAGDSRLFDDKLTNQAAFCFDGQRGGVSWKGKLERYFISKCPALMNILRWAEKFEGNEIDEPLLKRAIAGTHMNEELMTNANGSIWGFLSNCVSAEAETIFKTAKDLQGFDAWRRLVRYIDHGKEIKLESMRTEMKMLHLKPIKNLESVPIGIAEFDLKMKEYHDAGGTLPSESEMKNDLLRILPESLQGELLWRATDPGPYTRFRDVVRAQASRTLLTRRRLPLHNVEDDLREQLRAAAHGAGEDDEDEPPMETVEDLIAAFRNGKFQPRQRRDRQNPSARLPRRCANCGKEHKELKCPHPAVAVEDRVCWNCGKKNHQAKNCPEQKANRSAKVNAVDDRPTGHGLRRLCVVAHPDGFTEPRRTCKPQHVTPTLKDFVDVNPFAALGGSQKQKKAARQATRLQAASMDALASLPSTSAGTGGQGRPGYHRAEAVEDFTPEVEELVNIIAHASDGPPSDTSTTAEAQKLTFYGPIVKPRVRETNEDFTKDLAVLTYAADEAILTMADEEVKVKVAADTGAVDSVIGIADLPRGVVPSGNKEGNHFVGPSGETIERYGSCDTIAKTEHGEQLLCGWQVADVTRALQSISQVTGPEDGDGLHEVLFTNKKGVVVPTGFVEEILKRVKPIFQYDRTGGLYVTEMTLSSFTRQGHHE